MKSVASSFLDFVQLIDFDFKYDVSVTILTTVSRFVFFRRLEADEIKKIGSWNNTVNVNLLIIFLHANLFRELQQTLKMTSLLTSQ